MDAINHRNVNDLITLSILDHVAIQTSHHWTICHHSLIPEEVLFFRKHSDIVFINYSIALDYICLNFDKVGYPIHNFILRNQYIS